MKVSLFIASLLVSVQSSAGEAECQNLDNCPHCYNNTLPDYDPADPDGLVVSNDLQNFMQSTMDEYLDMVQKYFPPTSSDTDPSVFNGVGGRALLYLRMYDRDGNTDNLDIATAYIENSLTMINNIGSSYCGFLWGKTGVYAVAAAIYDRMNNTDSVSNMVNNIITIFENSISDNQAPYDDWDAGRSGLLYASEFLENNLYNYKTFVLNGDIIISRDLMTAIATAIVNRGNKLSDSPGNYLQWISPNDGGKWLGQSHGSAGVLHGLLLVPEVFINNATARSLIIGTLNHIVSLQQPSGNFPTEYYNTSQDELVQWDHGSPGVMSILAQAAFLYSNSTNQDAKNAANVSGWLNSALKAADCTWERGLLVKGLQLCHGISGNTYMQLTLAKWFSLLNENVCDSCDPNKYIWRAIQFQNFVSATPDVSDPELMRKPTPSPYDFYTASYESAAATWADLLAHPDSPIETTMPAY